VGPPPIITDNGLILLLHNASRRNADGSAYYSCGQLVLSPTAPATILAQLTVPWLEPTTYEEKHGLVPDVTFVEGLVFFDGSWLAYYGQSDTTVGVATYRVGDRYSALRRG
jgi:predicted GH43/DUF377 family glycosyl hydrolase